MTKRSTPATPSNPKLLTVDLVKEGTGNKVIVRARVAVTDPAKQGQDAMKILGSPDLKNDVYARRGDLGLSEFGIERHGGPSPYCAKGAYERDGAEPIAGYEQLFRFTLRG